MDPQKDKFLKNEFLTMSVFGGLGRSGTYSKSATEEARKNFRNDLRDKLDEISREYQSMVTEEEHLSNIRRLSDELSSQFSHCLKNGRFRIGIAQKALNLYLKYLWCVNLIAPPPHCPFDSIVISHLPDCKDLNWTSIDNIEVYSRLVKAARRVAKDKPLPEWELEIWLNGVQSERGRKGLRKSRTEKRHKETSLGPSQSDIEEKIGAVAIGTIVRPGFYATGRDRYEISIHKKGSNLLPHEKYIRNPINIYIGNTLYEAGVHETGAGVVWISSVLYKKEEGRIVMGARLIDALAQIGLRWKDKVIIKKNEDGTFLLEPYNDDTT
ncbi:MAG: hypothetical protein A2Y80_03390 [Deltaproteobacteria bacterium RBG_13_58_19]|nr:MAG: hypothetical protein A2Y80_03390 [Deltaproteobacteria bacterium RBG_13_58_19]